MIALALIVAQASLPPTLAQARALSPAAAGDAVLHDLPHGPIETFEPAPGGMLFPDMIEEQLVERPIVRGRGCVRTRWTVKFRAAAGAAIDTATPDTNADGVYGAREIALASNGACPPGHYAHLNSGVSADQGWRALAKLEAVTAGADHAQFRCADSTSSGLCNGDRVIRAALRTIRPWAINRDNDGVFIWLGAADRVVTEVRFPSADPTRVVVTRREAPPF